MNLSGCWEAAAAGADGAFADDAMDAGYYVVAGADVDRSDHHLMSSRDPAGGCH